MNSMIYNPSEEFSATFKDLHRSNTEKFLDGLVERSGVNVEENRLTVKQYDELSATLIKMKKKLSALKFWRVIMCITLVLIPLVFLKMTPKIKALREEIEQFDQKKNELFSLALSQMAPLVRSFSDKDSLRIVESTLPSISFNDTFAIDQEINMSINYDFCEDEDRENSTIDVLSGQYNGNPFLFEQKLVHKMGVETYHGYKTIYWTETYRDSDGKVRTRTRSETLHAMVTKPKPFYSTQILLNYCAQGGPELSFSREASHVSFKNEKELEKHVKKGEKKLKKLTDEALKENRDFVSMSNSEFEVLFDATDRNNEVQYRTLFTPLAQTNMVKLITEKNGYGDDFNFTKTNRTNRIITSHSQSRSLILLPTEYASHSFDIIKNKFISANVKFFKDVYFDFAPILAIPIYQESPVHSLDPIPALSQKYSQKETEALANTVDPKLVVHPDTQTCAILRTEFVASHNAHDEIKVTAYSYDVQPRVDFVTVHGGDGRFHQVAVPWNEYVPLTKKTRLFVSQFNGNEGKDVISKRNNLCIFK